MERLTALRELNLTGCKATRQRLCGVRGNVDDSKAMYDLVRAPHFFGILIYDETQTLFAVRLAMPREKRQGWHFAPAGTFPSPRVVGLRTISPRT